MIGLALSGGGSRAMAYHLGCLRALSNIGILKKINVLSTISGGSVIGAYYAYTPNKSFGEFESDIRGFLREGFQRAIAHELCKPTNLFPCLAGFVMAQSEYAASVLFGTKPTMKRRATVTEVFCKVLRRQVFSRLELSSPRRDDIDIVIGACELRTGTAFRFGNNKSGCYRHGQLIGGNVDVALAVTASAAYPILLPALERSWKFLKDGHEREIQVLLIDGGVYDNLGLQVLEPGRDPGLSIHVYPCEYVIVCNAGPGQESGEARPSTFMPRIVSTFQTIHRRAQDSTMHRLHQLKDAGKIRGFALPYLGQIDDQLPWKPPSLVPRSEVVKYPTNFAAMPERWIEKLSARGEQLTRVLVSHYLKDIL